MRQHGKFTRLLDETPGLDATDRQAAKDFLRDMRTAGRPATTIDNYENALLGLHRWLAGNRPGVTLVTAGREEISEYLIWVGDHQSGSTKATWYARLHKWYAWLLEESLIDGEVHPMARVPRPQAEDKAPEVLSDAQLTALLDTTKDWKKDLIAARDRSIIMILCEPGSPRASEIAGMELEDMDVTESDSILLRGKGGIERVIPVEDVTARVISRYLLLLARQPWMEREAEAARRAGRKPRVWLGKRGPMTRSGILQILKSRGDEAGIAELGPHRVRHTTYDRCDGAGMSARQAEALFGWKRGSKMTSVYGRQAAARRAVDEGRKLGLVSRLA